MRAKGDGVGKSGREEHGEEGTCAGTLKWGYSAEGTDGARAGLRHKFLHGLWVGKQHKLF